MQNRRDGFKLSLTVRNNLIERSVEDDETTTALADPRSSGSRDWIKSSQSSRRRNHADPVIAARP